MCSNLLLNSHSLNIPKVLRPNVDNHHIQGMDEFLHHLLLIHQNSIHNENILINRTLYRKMDTSAFFSPPWICRSLVSAIITLALHSAALQSRGVDNPLLFQSRIEMQNAPLTNRLLSFSRFEFFIRFKLEINRLPHMSPSTDLGIAESPAWQR